MLFLLNGLLRHDLIVFSCLNQCLYMKSISFKGCFMIGLNYNTLYGWKGDVWILLCMVNQPHIDGTWFVGCGFGCVQGFK